MSEPNRAVVLVEAKYENLELWYPYWRLREHGLAVDIVGPECGKTYGSKEGYPCTSDTPIVEALERTYEALIVPGGWAPDRLRRYPDILRLVKKTHDEGGIIASICHGPWVLVSAKILEGRKVTCVGAIKRAWFRACASASGKPMASCLILAVRVCLSSFFRPSLLLSILQNW